MTCIIIWAILKSNVTILTFYLNGNTIKNYDSIMIILNNNYFYMADLGCR